MASHQGQVAQDAKVNVSSETCTDHNRPVVYTCLTCDGEFVCERCVIQGHNGHRMGDLQKHIVSQRHAVLRVLHHTDEHLEQLDSDIANVKERMNRNDTEAQILISQIEERGRVLKDHIDEIVANGRKRSKRYQNKNNRILNKVRQKYTKRKTKLEEKANKCRDLVNSSKYTDRKEALLVGTELEENLSANHEMTSTRSGTFIAPSPSEDIAALESLFGKLKIDTDMLSAVSLTLNSSFFNENNEAVFRLCPVMDGDAAWIGGDECNLNLFTKEGDHLQTIELRSGVNDLCYVPQSNDLATLVVACEDNTIRKIMPEEHDEGSPGIELFTLDSDPQSISFTADSDIVIVSQGQEKPIKVDMRGERKPLGSSSKNDVKLTSPNTVRMNADSGDVAVLNNEPGCLYVWDEKLNLKFTYRGVPIDEDSTDDTGFDPQGVTFDRDGNILVADMGRGCVILLNKEGHFLQTLITSQDGPQAVEILQESATHVLWVGYSNGKVETYTYTFR